MINLSQFDEAEIVAKFFGSYTGRFIDIGAASGVALSNTFQLGLLSWGGLFVEPSPINFACLLQNYHNRGGFKFLNAALWKERDILPFHLNFGFGSSFYNAVNPERFFASYLVPTVTADDLVKIEPSPDFISLDVEYADLIVFPSLMQAYPNCKLICCEHVNSNQTKSQWHDLFDRFKLKVIAETPENYIASK